VLRGERTSRFCPTGKSVARFIDRVSSPFCKNISVFPKSKSDYMIRCPVPLRGALRNVNDAERDAVDAAARLTSDGPWRLSCSSVVIRSIILTLG
jgi:hypothetical protein